MSSFNSAEDRDDIRPKKLNRIEKVAASEVLIRHLLSSPVFLSWLFLINRLFILQVSFRGLLQFFFIPVPCIIQQFFIHGKFTLFQLEAENLFYMHPLTVFPFEAFVIAVGNKGFFPVGLVGLRNKMIKNDHVISFVIINKGLCFFFIFDIKSWENRSLD